MKGFYPTFARLAIRLLVAIHIEQLMLRNQLPTTGYSPEECREFYRNESVLVKAADDWLEATK